MWFIAYHHSLRPEQAGVKFVHGETAAVAEREHLESLGYVVKKIEPTSKVRMEALFSLYFVGP